MQKPQSPPRVRVSMLCTPAERNAIAFLANQAEMSVNKYLRLKLADELATKIRVCKRG